MRCIGARERRLCNHLHNLRKHRFGADAFGALTRLPDVLSVAPTTLSPARLRPATVRP
jgi:hypothetical protein